MKTLIVTLSLVLLTTLSFAQFPQSEAPDSCSYIADDLRVAIFIDKESLVNVKIAKYPGELVKVRVKENNEVLYQERIKSHAIADRKYDVSQFPNGTYVVEIVKDKKVVFSQTIELGLITENYALRK